MNICPNCGDAATETFYEVGPIPSHSCLLVDTVEEAMEFPRAPLQIAVCNTCGFIFNRLYDANLKDYKPTYEETQHFSSHFSSFAKSLAQRWIDDYGLRGKHILEIGCGKGEFLQLICQLGDNRGTGIDPTCIPERLEEDGRQRIDFMREYYGPQHAALQADAILCRHTLEHIPNTMEFLAQIRETLGDNTDVTLLFELPDTTRILHECAFWDMYYEHCSYFCAGSLARLFRLTGFDVIELERVYDEQYLILAAKPSKAPTQPNLAIEDDLAETLAAAQTFKDSIGQVTSTWKQQVDELSQKGRTIIWGSGSKSVSFLTTLGLTEQIEYLIDINPHKSGKFQPGGKQPICSPDQVRQAPPDAVVVMNPVYEKEIRQALAKRNCHPQIVCLDALDSVQAS